jgi:hypothetical protein
MTIMKKPGEKQGGTTTVRIESFVPDADFLAINPSAEKIRYWVLCVKDEGVGIPPEIKTKIFDPFFTTKPPEESSGLGLSMVHSIAKQHKGFVEVFSEPGQGTEFRVYFPAVENVRETADARAKNVQKGSGLVLIAEDEEVLRESSAAMLKALGYEAIIVNDGAEAVKTFAECPNRFTAVVLDYTMPAMNGEEAMERILEIAPDARVVIASGFAMDDTLENLKRKGLKAFLQKPFTVSEIADALAQALQESRPSEP